MRPALLTTSALLLSIALPAAGQSSQTAPAPPAPTYAETVQVTATRIPEAVETVPTSIEVVTADELRERGATDLQSALALVSGVLIAPGGDGGPASAVPQFWGLQEQDAYLLVVDGVPWGGAFNPDVATLDLKDVDRIEVQHGPAPVMYGATSFVGVIQVIRRAPGTPGTSITAGGGSYGSYNAMVSTSLPTWLGFGSSLVADYQKQGFQQDRTSFNKGHLLWRNQRTVGQGTFRFDLDVVFLRQQPGSPSPRTGTVLSPLVPIDSNQNPDGAYLDQDRYFLNVGYDHPLSFGGWSTTLSYTYSNHSTFRGFLIDVSETDPNAHGFRDTVHVHDLYFDTHLAWTRAASWNLVAGIDYLYGKGTGQGGDFDYFVNLDGANPPSSSQLPSAADINIRDRRSFAGLYGQVQWLPSSAWRIEAGLRLNLTDESRAASTLEYESGDYFSGEDSLSKFRPSGSLGVTWTAWVDGGDSLNVFANWRNTYKPAAVDFGLDSEAEILQPETSNSYELGLKSELLDRALSLDLSGYWMDFQNLVVSQAVDGLPVLANAGSTRLKGINLSATWRIVNALVMRGSYAWQDARFEDYLTQFDGEPTQLSGNRLEMSPQSIGAFALSWSPATGLFASAEISGVGNRFLNKRNTALAPGFATVDAMAGWRAERWEVRLAGRNLTDRRDPVAESELGDAQYYRLPGRRVDLIASARF